MSKIYIIVDTSYWIFYRFYAIVRCWRHAYPENPLPANPYECAEFVEKFKKTFVESMATFKKKQKIKNCVIYAACDCHRKDIWRNALYDGYKESRVKEMAGVSQFFQLVFDDEGLLLKNAGIDHILKSPKLEADDVAALTKMRLRANESDAKIYIITSDHDYLQLLDEHTELINFQNKNLRDAKNVFPEPEKNLFCKIVLGDKSDNIAPVFQKTKCGPKTVEKYYANQVEFLNALEKEGPEAQARYRLNKTLIDFNEIPVDLR